MPNSSPGGEGREPWPRHLPGQTGRAPARVGAALVFTWGGLGLKDSPDQMEPRGYLFVSWISVFHYGHGGWIWRGHPEGPGEGRGGRGCA